MGTQKNRLDETVLLGTQNICLKLRVRKYLQVYAQKLCLSKPMNYNKAGTVILLQFENFLNNDVFLFLKFVFILKAVNSAELDDKKYNAAFNLGPHCLSKYMYPFKSHARIQKVLSEGVQIRFFS